MRRIPLGLAVGFAILAPVWWPVSFGHGDHLIFWAAGHAIAVGGTPYDREAWVALASSYPSPHLEFLTRSGHEIWLYPPWTALLFVPFGMVPLDAGPWLVHLSYVAASIVVSVLLIELLAWRTTSARTLAALLAIGFQPLVIAARWGQFTSWTLLGVVVAVIAVRRMLISPLIGGAILTIAKPQYAVLPGLAIAGSLVRRRAWRAIVWTSVALLATALIAFALEPRALGAVTLGAGQRAGAFDRFPTTWGFARLIAPEAWPTVLGVLLATGLIACGAAIWAAGRGGRDEIAAWASLALGVVLTPYALTYEHALLLPAIVSSVHAADRCARAARAVVLSAVVAVWATAWGVFLFTTGAPLGFLPVATVTVFGAAHLAARCVPATTATQPHTGGG